MEVLASHFINLNHFTVTTEKRVALTRRRKATTTNFSTYLG
jgi:hypothetical protein